MAIAWSCASSGTARMVAPKARWCRFSSAARRPSWAQFTVDALRPRVRRALRQAAAGGCPDSARRDTRRRGRRDGHRGNHAVAHADARPAGPHRRSARRHQRPGRGHRDHPAEVRHHRRARPRGGGRGHADGHRGEGTGPQGPHRLPGSHRRDHRRRARPRLRRRHLHLAAAERPLLAGRAHRRRRALRARGKRARHGGVRPRHLGVLPGTRRAHVPVGTGHRPLQPAAARGSPRAVVPDGGDGPGRRGPLRDARRRDPQRRADDLHRGQRHPDRRAIRR